MNSSVIVDAVALLRGDFDKSGSRDFVDLELCLGISADFSSFVVERDVDRFRFRKLEGRFSDRLPFGDADLLLRDSADAIML